MYKVFLVLMALMINTICFAEVKHTYDENDRSFIIKYEQNVEVNTNTFSLKTGKFIPSDTIAKIVFSKYYWFDKNRYNKKDNKYNPVYSVSFVAVGKTRFEIEKMFWYELFENDELLLSPYDGINQRGKRAFFDDVENRVEVDSETYSYTNAIKFLKDNHKLISHLRMGKPAEIVVQSFSGTVVLPIIKINAKQAAEIKDVLDYDLYADDERLAKIDLATLPPKNK